MERNNSKNWWKNSWFITIVGGIIVSIISLILDYLTPLNLFILAFFLKIWSWLNFKLLIPIWLVIFGLIVLFLIFFILKQIKEHMEIQQKSRWVNYKIDTFFDKLFAWEYEKANKDKIIIINLRQICKKCQCGLVKALFPKKTKEKDNFKTNDDIDYKDIATITTKFFDSLPEFKPYCPNCNNIYKDVYPLELEKIEKLIKYKINTGKYKNSPYFKR